MVKLSIRRNLKPTRALQLGLALFLVLLSSVPTLTGAEEGVEQESPPPREESPPPREDLFELNIYECKPPGGEAANRPGPLTSLSVLTLCFRPQNEEQATLKSISFMYIIAPDGGPKQAAIRDGEAAGPTTKSACPFEPTLCIASNKLDSGFFEKSYKGVVAKGEVVVGAAGEERSVPFEYNFSTEKAPKQQPIEHEFFTPPAVPPPFPCGREITIWLLSALILTLLEFAFSPDDKSSLVNQAKDDSSASGTKKKKGKKE